MSNTQYNNLFSSIISDIKSYNGKDPLLPWLRGIKKMKESVPNELLKEKLPRFLQKCAETFQTDRRYSNDLRYLRVWLQLMDFVEDPKAILRTMEMNRIGIKKSLFYQAYALYYEKIKKFDAAEKIYHLGVQNLAEPAVELQMSYDQFLHRMQRHRNKQIQGILHKHDKVEENANSSLRDEPHGGRECLAEMQSRSMSVDNKLVRSKRIDNGTRNGEANNKPLAPKSSFEFISNELHEKLAMSDCGGRSISRDIKVQCNDSRKIGGDDTTVVKFVDTAVVGRSNAEDARHHGLVEPTINTKEAINAINNMFREPIEPSIARRRSGRNQPKPGIKSQSGFEVFTDEIEINDRPSKQRSDKDSLLLQARSEINQPPCEALQIYIDNEDPNDATEQVNEKEVHLQVSSGFLFPRPNDHPKSTIDLNDKRAHKGGFREDTVVYRFVGSTISDEPEVENVCHHGLVDPTINLKEAMNDINSMFGKPIEFARKRRSKKQEKALDMNDCGGFMILSDDLLDNQKARKDRSGMFEEKEFATGSRPNKVTNMENNDTGFLILPDDAYLDNQHGSSLPTSSHRTESDLFEQTLCTKDAMAEINKMFGMPLDF